jgi:hypothetical protein
VCILVVETFVSLIFASSSSSHGPARPPSSVDQTQQLFLPADSSKTFPPGRSLAVMGSGALIGEP